MKSVVFALITFSMSFSALASGAVDNVTCFENAEDVARTGVKHAVLVNRLGDSLVYELKLLEKRSPRGQYKEVLTERVRTSEEDVMLWFKNKKSGVTLTVYMDELDQSNLEIRGRDLTLTCRVR